MWPADKTQPRAGQYLRVSVDRSGRARSNEEQQRDNERDAERQGYRMVRTYRDPDRSASRYATKAREEYQQLLRDIDHAAIDVLYLWEPSRGSRRVSEWVTLIELAETRHVLIRVTSHSRTYDPANPRDRRSLLEDAVDSEYESGKVSVRVKRAMAAAAAEGRPHGMVPYGYTRTYDPRSGLLLKQVPDPETAPVVREIVDRILRGDAIRSIAHDLTVRDVPTPAQLRDMRAGRARRPGEWTRSSIRTLLRSPTLLGMRVHEGEVVGAADWEPLVNVDDLARAREMMGSRLLQSNPGSSVKHLLSGIAECGVCGARCDRQVNNGIDSYTCAGLPPRPGEKRPSRRHVSRAQAPVDALVTSAVIRRLEDPHVLAWFAQAQAQRDDEAAAAERELADIDAQMAEYVRMAQQSTGIAASAFAEVVTGLGARREAAQARLSATGVVPPMVLELAGPDAAQRWDALPLERRRQVVRTLLRVVIHRAGRRGARGFDASSVELVWRQSG